MQRASCGEFSRPPDLVAFPRDAGDVGRLLDWCSSLRFAAIPFGGGLSVVGGVEPDVGESYGATISIDLARMGAVQEVDTVSRAVSCRVGRSGRPSRSSSGRTA